MWYSGNKKDLWIEYKFLPSIPKKVDIKLDLSDLQKLWLRNRYNEGRSLAVICGCKAGGVLLTDLMWELPMSPAEFEFRIQTRQQLAESIHNLTSNTPYEFSKNIVRGRQISKPDI